MAVQKKKPAVQEKEEEEKQGGGGRRFLVGFLIFILIIGAAAFAMYYAYNHFMGGSTTTYENSIVDINGRVTSANDDFAAVIKNNDDFSSQEVKDALSSAYDEINNINNDLGEIVAPSTFSESNSKLVEAARLNKTIYQQLKEIINSPLNTDVQKNIDSMALNIEQCMDNYLEVNIKGCSFKLPDELQNLPSKMTPWVQQKQDEYAEISSLMESFIKYFDSVSKIIVDYDSTKVDISKAVSTARADRSSWDQPLSMIDDNEAIVMLAKDSYTHLKVPSQLRAFNDEFAPILDDTLSYYTKLRLALQTDMGFDKEGLSDEEAAAKTAEIEALYQDAEASNSAAAANYQKFTATFAVQKDKFSNPEYVMSIKAGN